MDCCGLLGGKLSLVATIPRIVVHSSWCIDGTYKVGFACCTSRGREHHGLAVAGYIGASVVA